MPSFRTAFLAVKQFDQLMYLVISEAQYDLLNAISQRFYFFHVKAPFDLYVCILLFISPNSVTDSLTCINYTRTGYDFQYIYCLGLI